MQRCLPIVFIAWAMGAWALPADLDPAWGEGGVGSLGPDASGSYPTISAIASMPDGGALVAIDHSVGQYSPSLFRLDRTGHLDAGFGTGGVTGIGTDCGNARALAPSVAGFLCGVHAAALLSDGAIVTVHRTSPPLPYFSGTGVARFGVDGQVDRSFGNGGLQNAPGGSDSDNETASVVVVDALGRIVVGASRFLFRSAPSAAKGWRPVLFRFLGNGVVDTTFGSGGVASLGRSQGGVAAIGVLPDGRILVATSDQPEYAGDSRAYSRILSRLMPDGTLDPAYGISGAVDLPITGDAFAGIALALPPGGKPLLATIGTVEGAARALVVRRLSDDGSIDPSFGVAGTATALSVAEGQTLNGPDIAVQSDGKIVVAATRITSTSVTPTKRFFQVAVARLDSDGVPDTRFAGAGAESFSMKWGLVGTLGDSGKVHVEVQRDGGLLIGASSVDAFGFFAPSPGGGGSIEKTTPLVLRLLGGDAAMLHLFVEAPTVEYFHSGYGHYFMTTGPIEIAALDMQSSAPWARTRRSFRVWDDAASGASPVCRFWSGQTFAPKSSHFYTPLSDECAGLKTSAVWQYEGTVFQLGIPVGTPGARACPNGSQPLYRMYNNGMSGAPNHRYTTDPLVLDQMIALGWTMEGEAQTKVFACLPAAQ